MEIDADLEPLTVYSYHVSPALDALVRHVLATIPECYVEEFPSFSVFESLSRWGAHVERADDEEVAAVFCNPNVLQLTQDVRVGVLAHEFAHVYLGHTGAGGLHDEHEADALARRWGFDAQVAAMREHAGPPTLESGGP